MNHSALMGEANRAAYLVHVRQQSRHGRKMASLKLRSESLALDELHAQVDKVLFLANVINGDDVGMVEASRRLGLLLQPLDQFVAVAEIPLNRNGLQRDRTPDNLIECLVN